MIKIQPNSISYYWAFQVWKFIISTANFRSYPKFMTENSSHFNETPCKSPSKAKLFKKESWRSLELQEWESHRVPNRMINLISMQRQLHNNSNGWCNEILIFSNSLQLKTEMWLKTPHCDFFLRKCDFDLRLQVRDQKFCSHGKIDKGLGSIQ